MQVHGVNIHPTRLLFEQLEESARVVHPKFVNANKKLTFLFAQHTPISIALVAHSSGAFAQTSTNYVDSHKGFFTIDIKTWVLNLRRTVWVAIALHL